MFKILADKPKKKVSNETFCIYYFFSIHLHSKDNHLQMDNLAKFQE